MNSDFSRAIFGRLMGTMRIELRRPCGFSLIELLLVMAIFGILLVLVAPGIGSMVASRGAGMAEENMVAVLQRARLEAQTKNTYVWVGFNDETGSQRDLLVAAVASKDGSGTNSSADNLIPVVRAVRLGNTGLLPRSDLDASVRALDTRPDAACLATDSAGLAFDLGNREFSNSVLFTPQGAVSTAPTADPDTGYTPALSIGLGAFRGTQRNPREDLIVVLDGATGMPRALRLQ